jgi:hypothetical protein
MRHIDDIQVDRSYYKALSIIDKLRTDKRALEQEVKQLRNLWPEEMYATPQPGLKIKVIGTKVSLNDPIEKWNSRHFIYYFQHKFKEKYNETYPTKKDNWKAWSIRIKQFRDGHPELRDNKKYKEMIDWAFKERFNKKFVASIVLISIDTIFVQWNIARKSKPSQDFSDVVVTPLKSKKNAEQLFKDF